MAHDVQWYSPAPLWHERLQNGASDRLQTPELLRFEQDDFMSELQETLEETPNDLDEKRAKGEKYLGRNGSTASVEEPIPLYQPAHERYYLVTASLVCRERGLPDRAVDTTSGENAAFVLRRLEEDPSGGTVVDDQQYTEYGWMTAPSDSQSEAASTAGKAAEGAWRRVENPLHVRPQEERLSMFPQPYDPVTPQERMKGRRRLWAGLIPVAKRDTYETAPVERDESGSDGKGGSLPDSGDPLSDPRKTKFDTQVLGAFRGMRTALRKEDSEVSGEDVRDPLVFAWYDLWEFLGEHLGSIQAKIRSGAPVRRDDPEILRVLDAIEVSEMGLGERATDVLRVIGEKQKHIEAGRPQKVLDVRDLPGSLNSSDDFNLNREMLADAIDRVLAETYREARGEVDYDDVDGGTPLLKTAVYAELGPLTDPSALPDDLQPPATDPVDGGMYVVRCLYERPNCPPSLRTTVSEPSRPFRLASFFDAEAPARDINIALPGASVQDFRDSSQRVSMVFTKELRKQAERIQNVTMSELQDGEIGSAPKVDIGMICSLSIPIITICALILLLIMVVLLNIVFWWLPFFKICFPVPSSD